MWRLDNLSYLVPLWLCVCVCGKEGEVESAEKANFFLANSFLPSSAFHNL